MEDPEKIKYELEKTGSAHIKGKVLIKNGGSRYRIFAGVDDPGRLARIDTVRNIPLEQVELYVDVAQTVCEWEENGYSSVQNWAYQETDRTGHPEWRTPEDNYVRISRRGTNFTASKMGELAFDDLIGASTSELKIDLSASLLLHSVSSEKFDYLCAKYKSMWDTLQEIHGIGSKVSTELLKEQDCETYRDVKLSLHRTDLPQQYIRKAKREVKNHISEEGDTKLMDPTVNKKYSGIIVANEI